MPAIEHLRANFIVPFIQGVEASIMQLSGSPAYVMRPSRILTLLTKWSSCSPAPLAACKRSGVSSQGGQWLDLLLVCESLGDYPDSTLIKLSFYSSRVEQVDFVLFINCLRGASEGRAYRLRGFSRTFLFAEHLVCKISMDAGMTRKRDQLSCSQASSDVEMVTESA